MSHPEDRFQLETGLYSRDVDTQRLKKLDLNDLSIAETGSYPRPPGLTDPNDHSSTTDGNVGNSVHGATPGALKPEDLQAPEALPPRKPLDRKQLEEWRALRKRVEPDSGQTGD
ncbi:hypothetical protein JM946_06055 [Steroidobacter sp. S1-65]|uniref:Uncharacterized protein n=1 Tax=Steroidobacter gossypii TaxID=2805490 RepID=A0ABS1WTJ3_9GAMM|nr:hypothetical protein [Steroidobacter gossypii]MBM0104299.1 hypothetical protein [Steroidobacter gossypii]